MDIIDNCRQYFGVKLPFLWSEYRFEKKLAECNNIFLQNVSFNSKNYSIVIVSLTVCFLFFFSCVSATINGE